MANITKQLVVIAELRRKFGDLQIRIPEDDRTILPTIRHGVYESHLQRLFFGLIKDKDIVFDIGANLGQHTIVMSKLTPHGLVLAVEGSEHNYGLLKESLALNGCGNVNAICALVTDRCEEVAFCHRENHVGVSFISGNDYGLKHHADNMMYARTTTLDQLTDLTPNFIKMDIEGSESLAIKGAKRIFSKLPTMVIELNSFTCQAFRNISIHTVIDEILALGYQKIAVYSHEKGDWVYIDDNTLRNAFDSGAVIIDACFMK